VAGGAGHQGAAIPGAGLGEDRRGAMPSIGSKARIQAGVRSHRIRSTDDPTAAAKAFLAILRTMVWTSPEQCLTLVGTPWALILNG
jgi:hypothetical protein